MRIRPLPEKKGQPSLAAVILQDASTIKNNITVTPGTEVDISHEAEQRIADLEQDLQFTKENLQATIEELETSNEELQATNEELLASNEELQSTNEELQSVNEELHTVNAEYQKKILELTEITNDLDNLISATEIATIFLDENLDIRKFTPAAADIFRILRSDIGRPIAHLTHRLMNMDIMEVLHGVEKTKKPYTIEACTEKHECYLMRVLPYKIGGSDSSGLLLTFTDVQEYKRNQAELAFSNDVLLKTQEMAHVGSWKLDLKSGDLDWSDEIYRIFGVNRESFRPSYETFLNMVHPDERASVAKEYFNALREGVPYKALYRVVRPDGETRCVQAKTFETHDSNGEALISIGMIHDQTELISAREAQRSVNVYLNSIIDAMPACVAILDQNGVLEYINKSWRDFRRDNDASVPGGAIGSNYLHECKAAGAPFAQEAALLARALQNEESDARVRLEVNYPWEHDGETRWFSVKAIPFESPQGRRIKIIREDITEFTKFCHDEACMKLVMTKENNADQA